MKRVISYFILFFLMFSSMYGFKSIHQIQDSIYENKPFPTPYYPYKITSLNRNRTPKVEKNIVGFSPYWVDNTYLHYDLLTTIALFSVDVNSDGTINNSHNFPAHWSYVIQKAHENGVKVVLTATNFSSSSISSVVGNSTYQNNCINGLLNLVQSAGIDGVNIDFEGVPSGSKDSLSSFMTRLTNTFHSNIPGSEVTICGPAVDWSGAFDYDVLCSNTDGIFVMAYDYYYGGSSYTGPVSLLKSGTIFGTYSVEWTINDYLNYSGGQNDKIIIGLPYYGYDWPASSAAAHSSTTGSGSAVIYTSAHDNALNYGRLWEASVSNPWYTYGSYHQCWYDDKTSLHFKYNDINANNLLGTGMWALGYDGDKKELWTELRESFGIPYSQLVNGDMELIGKDTMQCPSDTVTHVSGWLEGDYADNHIASDFVHSGNYSLKQVINNWGEAGVKKSFLYEDININPGVEYIFTAYGRKYDGSGNIMYIEAETFDSLHQSISTYISDSLVSDSNAFLPLSLSFLADGESKFARFKLIIKGDTSWDRWDDVSIISSDSITSFDTLFVVNVNDSTVRIYDNPGGTVIDSAIAGTKLMCNSYTSDNWYRVFLPGGTFTDGYGWIYGGNGISDSHLSGSQCTNYVMCKTGGLNIRKGPGTSYDVITYMTNGQYFAFIDSSGYWYHIYIPTINGETEGWASNNGNSYLNFISGGPKMPYGAYLDSMDYPSVMFVGDSAEVNMIFKNIGNTSFDSSTILTISKPRYAKGNFYDSSWIDTSNIVCCTNNALPGQFVKLNFLIRGNGTGIFTDYVNLRENGFGWFSDAGNIGPSDSVASITVDVQPSGISKEETETFSPTISYYSGMLSIKNAERATIRIFDICGRNIIGDKINANYRRKLNLRKGVYFVVIEMGVKNIVKKIAVLE